MISFSNRNPASARRISALDRKIATSRFHHGHRETFRTANPFALVSEPFEDRAVAAMLVD